MKKGQASTEMIIITGIFFIVLLVFFTFLLDYLFSIRSQRDYGDAQSAVDTLAQEADATCAQGLGAEKVIKITIPPSASLSSNLSYIGRPLNSINGKSNTIAIYLNGSTVSAITSCTVVGTFPNATGIQYMRITSYGNFVGIGSHLASASPNEIFLSMGRGDQKTSTVTFSTPLTASLNQSVLINLTTQWSYGNVVMNISPSTFSTYGLSDVPVTLTFTTSANAIGIYTSRLNVTAVRQEQDGSISGREIFTVPLTLEVN